MKRFAIGSVALTAVLLLSACSSKPEPEAADTVAPPVDTAAPSEPANIPDPDGGLVNADMVVDAEVGAITSGFTPSTLVAPTGDELSITFNNNDAGIPHNIQIFEGTDATTTPIFAPADNESITGVASTTYNFGPLEAGTYTFNCFVHPTMVGTLTVQ